MVRETDLDMNSGRRVSFALAPAIELTEVDALSANVVLHSYVAVELLNSLAADGTHENHGHTTTRSRRAK